MRLFIAIPLDDAARASLSATVENARLHLPPAFKWVRPENYHLTLKFLGEVPESRLGEVIAACRAAVDSAKPLSLVATRLALHPPAGAVRLIVAAMQGEVEAAIAVTRHVEDALAGIGFPRESRPFWPHVTLARARSPMRLSATQREQWAAAKAAPGPTFGVSAIELIESQLRPTGPVYRVVQRVPLLG